MSEEKKTPEPESARSVTVGHSDDLEVAENFDDLNLEIVSEKPAPSSASNASENETESGPSIDEFVIVKEEHSVTEQDCGDQWFAEVLGQEIGPFPFEELVHLVANQEVGPGDKIRHTIQGEWMVAGEIAGLFPEIETDFELEGGAEFLDGETTEPVESSDLQVVGGELNHILTDTREKSPLAENQQEQKSQQNEQSDQNDVAEQDSKTEEVQENSEEKRKREIAERLNAWLGDQVKEPVSESKQEKQEHGAVTPVGSSSSVSASTGSATYQPPVKPGPPPKFKKTKQPREKIDFSALTSLLDTKVIAAVVAVAIVGAIFVFMPNLLASTNDQEIYERYQEIYAQIERARQGNPGQIATLAKEVVPELEETVTALENAGAGAKKPVKQKLFFGGKYCLIPILQKKIIEPGKLDEKFKKYQKEVESLLKK